MNSLVKLRVHSMTAIITRNVTQSNRWRHEIRRYKESLQLGDLWRHTIKMLIKLPVFLKKHQVMKMYGGVEMQLHAFLTSTIGRKSSASHPGRFTLIKKCLQYPLCRRLRGSVSQFGHCVKRRSLFPRPESSPEPRPLCPQSSRYTK